MIEVGIMFMPLLFFPLTSNDWNNLTFDPADAPSLDTFTRKLRKMSDQDTLEYEDSEHSSGMSDYASRSAVKISIMLLLLSTPLHQRAASRVQHPKSCGSQQSLPPGGKERLHFVGIRPEVQARKGGW